MLCFILAYGNSSHGPIKCEKELVPSAEPVPVHSGYSELIYTVYDKQSEAAVLT